MSGIGAGAESQPGKILITNPARSTVTALVAVCPMTKGLLSVNFSHYAQYPCCELSH